jgi:uncharacterized protein YndB with AHSA1/START domain
MTRIFDEPRELVFRAWIDPRFMARWWGPKASPIRSARWTYDPVGPFAST